MLGNLSKPFIWFFCPVGKERVELYAVHGGNFTGCLVLNPARAEALLCNNGDGVWVYVVLSTWCYHCFVVSWVPKKFPVVCILVPSSP